ncbi:MAG: hypothetical protein KAT56_07675 [Sedimentisphaerales bacterium]|nr:hypothetical protein [Sedimentisphaerales bacterium]
MKDLLHKILYTGIGFAALTEEKAHEIVAEMEQHGEVSGEEGKKLAQELIDKAKHQSQDFRKAVTEEVDKVAGRLGWVRREEFDQLRQRVEQMESRTDEAPTENS